MTHFTPSTRAPYARRRSRLAPAAGRRYRSGVVLEIIVTLMTLAFVAIPIVIVVKIARRVGQVTQRLRDPTRLQQVFAESAAAALRRAGADPKAIAKLEVLGMGRPGQPKTADLRVALQQARATLGAQSLEAPTELPERVQRAEFGVVVPPAPRPIESLRAVTPLRRTPRMRPSSSANRPLSLDAGDQFRLSEPPDIQEPQGPLPFGANWIAFAAVLAAAAYYFLR